MANYNDLPGKLELAFQKVLRDDANVTLADARIFKGHDSSEVLRPRVICHASDQWPDIAAPESTGIHRGQVSIVVETLATRDPESAASDYPEEGQRDLAPLVQDSATRSNMKDLLNAAAVALGFELTVVEVVTGTASHGISEDGTAFLDVLLLTVVAAGAAI